MTGDCKNTAYRILPVLFVLLGLGALEAKAQLPMANKPLPRVEGGTVTLSSLTGSQGTVVIFWSSQCPWTQRYTDRLAQIEQTFSSQGIGFVLINAGGAPEAGTALSGIPYLQDESGAMARAFGAERTPHVFVYDAQNTLVYVGAIDDSPADPSNVQKAYLRNVLEALVSGQPVPVERTAAYGCMISQ